MVGRHEVVSAIAKAPGVSVEGNISTLSISGPGAGPHVSQPSYATAFSTASVSVNHSSSPFLSQIGALSRDIIQAADQGRSKN